MSTKFADDLDAGRSIGGLMAPRSTLKWPLATPVRDERAVRLRFAPALTGKACFDGRKDFLIGNLEFVDIEAVEIGDVDRRQDGTSSAGRPRPPWRATKAETPRACRGLSLICLYIIKGLGKVNQSSEPDRLLRMQGRAAPSQLAPSARPARSRRRNRRRRGATRRCRDRRRAHA